MRVRIGRGLYQILPHGLQISVKLLPLGVFPGGRRGHSCDANIPFMDIEQGPGWPKNHQQYAPVKVSMKLNFTDTGENLPDESGDYPAVKELL